MEAQIAVEELARALYRAQGIVEKKSPMPILANVLLDAGKDSLVVTAFDLEVGLQSEHRAEVIQPGRLAVSARHLFDIVRSLSESTLVLRTAPNNHLEIRCGASHFRIVATNAEDYPALPSWEKIPFVSIPPKTLLEMVEKTLFSVSNDETRYSLNGVFFEPLKGGTARMVATDGHRLSLIERPLEGDFKLKAGVIIPKKGLFELKRLLAEESTGETRLGFYENAGVFQRTGLTMVMRLIDGQFPDYQHVLPKESEKKIRVGRVRLLETIKRVSLLAQDQSHSIRFELAPGLLRITSQNPDLGEAKDEIPLENSHAELQVAFNARYLIDVLAVLTEEEVRIELQDDLSPGVLYPEGDAHYKAVVMPVRI